MLRPATLAAALAFVLAPAVLVAVLAAVLVVVAFAAISFVRLRRQRAAQQGRDAADAVVLEAGRRMSAALDVTEVAEHAIDAIIRSTGASVGQLVAATERAEPVRSAVETGQPGRRRVDGADVIAVPCVGAGRVLGALVAVEPQIADPEAVLVALAGFVGPALAAADRHGSAAMSTALARGRR